MCTGRLNSGTQRQSMQSESTLAGQSACVKRLRVLAKSLPGPRGEHVRRVIASLAEFLEASAKQQNDEEERNLPSARIMINSLVKLVEQPSGSVEAILAATGLGMLVTSEPASRTTLIEVGGIRPLVELLVSAGRRDQLAGRAAGRGRVEGSSDCSSSPGQLGDQQPRKPRRNT